MEKQRNFQGYRKRLPLGTLSKSQWNELVELANEHGFDVIKSAVEPDNSVVESMFRQLSKEGESARNRQLKAENKIARNLIEELRKKIEFSAELKAPLNYPQISAIKEKAPDDATALIMLSDWHVEETVRKETINGLNEYNPDIARQRWDACIHNSMRLVDKERHDANVNELVVWLGGDFITGYIHEELQESNAMAPVKAVRLAKGMIISALEFYRKNGGFNAIRVVCNFGNHGRVWQKPRVSTAADNSFEWMMYMDIAEHYKSDPLFEFLVPEGILAYLDIYKWKFRFFHGDHIGYGGGIGGLTIPLIKAIHRMNEQVRADYNIMGHFHQYWEATKDCIVNGSGIGYNAYAQRINARPEEPTQGFRLIHSKYGLTTKLPIFCQ